MRLLISTVVLFFSFNTFASDIKDWTLMVFLNGHNNLDSFGATDINEMEKVGSTNKVNIVVQWASLKNTNTLRLLVKKDNDFSKVTSPIVQTLPRVDMGDANSLVEFVKWTAENYPAKKYFITVWNHGGGWHLERNGKLGGGFQVENISWDDITGNFMTTPQLGAALDASAQIIGHKVDIYGSDACLMAMPDVATQMKNSVSHFIGSEEVEPGDGWPYAEFLAEWNKIPSASADDVSKILIREYVKSYSEGGSQGVRDVTLSAFNLAEDKSDPMLASMKALGQSIYNLSLDKKKKVVGVISKSQSFTFSDYVDIGDFVKNLELAKIDQGLSAAVAQVRAALSNYVIANQVTPYFQNATGAAVWLPSSQSTFNSYYSQYQELEFHKQTGWGLALQSLFN